MILEFKVKLEFNKPVKNTGYIVDKVLHGLIEQTNGDCGLIHVDDNAHPIQIAVSTMDGQLEACSNRSQGYLLGIIKQAGVDVTQYQLPLWTQV